MSRRRSANPSSASDAGNWLQRIEQFPKSTRRSLHLNADHLELLCLTSPDGRLTKADVIDLRMEESDLHLDLDSDPTDTDEKPGGTATANDKLSQRVDEWFRLLAYRAGAFGEFYPFVISPNGQAIIRHGESELSLKRRFYVFLLLCSSLRCINDKSGVRQHLTSAFERLSLHAFRVCLPSTAQAHVFGTSKNGRFSGSFWEKLNQLVPDLQAQLLAKEADFAGSSGDGGLDLVGWVPLNDQNSGLLVVFGQCACSVDEWVQKQNESSYYGVWEHRMRLKSPSSNMMFIPLSFRASNGRWMVEDSVRSVLIDRERFLYLLKKRTTCFSDESKAYRLTLEALSFRRNVFE